MTTEPYRTPAPLTWSLVVPTFGRPAILARSISLALRQSIPPNQVIIVDAHPDSEAHRRIFFGALEMPSDGVCYMQTSRRSITHQRNLGIERVESDLTFLFDDDTLMYPECAQCLVNHFASDHSERIVGLNPRHTSLPPDSADTSTHLETKRALLLSFVVPLVRRILSADDIFQPYLSSGGRPTYPTVQGGLLGPV